MINYKEVLKEIWNKEDEYCEMYKIANDVYHDYNECQRITKVLCNLETAYKTIKEIFGKKEENENE